MNFSNLKVSLLIVLVLYSVASVAQIKIKFYTPPKKTPGISSGGKTATPKMSPKEYESKHEEFDGELGVPHKPSISDFKKGQWILDAVNRRGQVLQIIGSTIKYKANYLDYEAEFFELSYEVPQIGGLKRGRKVIDLTNRVGQITHLYSDFRVSYKANYLEYHAKASDLSPEILQSEGHKKTSNVIDDRNRFGKIIAIFQDGRIMYKVNYLDYVGTSLHLEVANIGPFKRGEVVIDRTNRIGVVLQVFDNGMVRYKSNYLDYAAQISDLSIEVGRVGECMFLRGQKVKDMQGRVGLVNYVFADGRVNYTVNYLDYTSAESLLSPVR